MRDILTWEMPTRSASSLDEILRFGKHAVEPQNNHGFPLEQLVILFLQDIPVAEDAGNQAKNQACKQHGGLE